MKKILISGLLLLGLLAVGCSNTGTGARDSASNSNTSVEAVSNKEFTLDELKNMMVKMETRLMLQ